MLLFNLFRANDLERRLSNSGMNNISNYRNNYRD